MEAGRVYLLLFSFVAATFIRADAELQPIKTQDLQGIVDSVKKDVDRHLKTTSAGRYPESISLPDPSEVRKSVVVEDVNNLLKFIQNSMHRRLVENLGDPSDVNDGTSYLNDQFTSEFSLPDHLSKQPESRRENSRFLSLVNEIRVGSAKGVPGVDFPDYTDIPLTAFTCSGKGNIPGFYADLDTGCQVFHICWPDRRESFLCPLGTTFNQALLVCDYWYNSNCSLAPHYYTVHKEMEEDSSKTKSDDVSSMIDSLLEKTKSDSKQKQESSKNGHATLSSVLSFVSQFIPIKAKIAVYPKTANQRSKIVTTASFGDRNKVKSKPRQKNRPSSRHLITGAEMDELRMKIFKFRLSEALDTFSTDIKNNETLSYLSEYVKKVAKLIKRNLVGIDNLDQPLEQISLEPGSELYKEDEELKSYLDKAKKVWSDILLISTDLMKGIERYFEKRDVRSDIHEHDALKSEPLTHLNPRFIIKPSTKENSRFKQDESTTFEKRSSASYPLPLSSEYHLNIYPETKRVLTKNYEKLFRSKHA